MIMSDDDKKVGDDNDEEVIWGWILEFLARKEKDGLVKNLMVGKYLPVPDRDLRLKKTILLRSIQSEIDRPSERLLDYLEHVRELDHAQGVGVSESMKSAYCAVAVEATVKFLEGSVDDRSSYFDAVVRIWQDRIRNLLYFEDTNGCGGSSSLLSDQLGNWKADIEAALWNTNVCQMLLGKYRKISAACLLRVYLKETWESMGPTFLELAASSSAAQAVILDSNNIYNAAHSGVTPGCGVSARACAATRGPQEQVQVQGLAIDPTHSPIPPLSRECEQNSFPVRTTTPSTEEASPNVNQNSPLADSVAPEDGHGTEMKKKDVLCKLKHVGSGDRRINRAMPTKGRGIKIRDTEELDNETLSERYNSVSAAHVHKAKAALMCSSLELKAAVKDPLPQAMRIAETLLGHMASKGITHEPQVENHNANVPAHASNAVSEALQANENNSRDLCCEADQANAGNPVNVSAEAAQANEDKPGIQGFQHHTTVPRPSLMARNSTAHISQWDDSDDTSPARLHLPSPRRTVISPLKRYEMKRIPRRRQNKRWSLLEEDTLRDAVHKHGKGNWKLILTIYADIFEERTEVDLKDKWRNMIR